MTTYYVSTAGRDTADGSSAAPWRTISHAMNETLRPGDEVVVRPGIYNEQVAMTQGGTENNHVVLRSEVPGEAVIRASGWNAVNVYANYVTIDGFDISSTDGGNGIFGKGVHHVEVLNNTVHDNGEAGIGFIWSEFLTIDGNTTYGNAWSGWFSGISVWESRNITGDTTTEGYRLIIRNNVSHDNVTKDGLHTDGNGIIIDDFQSTQADGYPNYDYPTLVENNLVYNNGGKGIAVHWSDNVTVRNNTAWHNNQDKQNEGTWRGELSNQDSNGTIWVNNIAVADPTVNPDNTAIGFYGNNSDVVWRNNLSFNGRTGDASMRLDGGNPALTKAQGNLLGVDPGFVKAPADFRLKAGSPGVDAGTDGFGVPGSDLDGEDRVIGAIDIGAYEIGGRTSNAAPVAKDDAGFTTGYGTALTLKASALLTNDTDGDADALRIVSVSAASGGSVRVTEQGDALFTPTTGYSGAAGFSYTVTDGHGGTDTATVSLTVGKAGTTASYFGAQARPDVVTDPDRDGVELGFRFRADFDGEITAIRFYQGPQNGGAHPVTFWTGGGTELGSGSGASTGTGWQEIQLDRPVAVSKGDISIASYHAPQGGYSASTRYFTSESGNGPLTALANAGVYRYGAAGSFPDSVYNASNYWVDVVFKVTKATHDGGTGADELIGGAGKDLLLGHAGNDRLLGGVESDVLRGQAGNDVLIGESGLDVLVGGKEADVFRFRQANDSRPGLADEIRAGDGAIAFEGAGRAGGDRIDLRLIDADHATAGNQAFRFGEAGKGGLWLGESNGATVVRGNLDGDAAAEFVLVIQDGDITATAYAATDFLL